MARKRPCPILGFGETGSLLILSVEGCVLWTEDWVCDGQEETERHVKEAWQSAHFASHPVPPTQVKNVES